MSGVVGSGDFDLDKAVDFDPDLSGSAVVVLRRIYKLMVFITDGSHKPCCIL